MPNTEYARQSPAHGDDSQALAAVDASNATTKSSSSNSITQNKLFKVVIAMAPVLIVMYIFNMLRSELRRIQNRLDTLAMRQKTQSQPVQPTEYAEFERYMMAMNTNAPPQASHAATAPPFDARLAAAPPPGVGGNVAENWAQFPQATSTPPPPPQEVHLPPQQPTIIASPPPTTPTTTQESIVIAGSQLMPQLQPEGFKKMLPRIEEIK